MDLDRKTGELLIDSQFDENELINPLFILGERTGWVLTNNEFRPLSYQRHLTLCVQFIQTQ